MSDDEDTEVAVTIDHDVTNEMIVIAACLVDQDIRDRYVLKESVDKFIDPDHALIWAGMKKVLQRKQGFDLQLLHNEVKGKVRLQYLKDLQVRYPAAPVSIGNHIDALHWDSTRARAVEENGAIPDFLRALKDNAESPATVQAFAERVARTLSVKLGRRFMSDPRLLAAQARNEIEKRKDIACYEYGIPELDYFPDGTHRCIPGAAPTKITNITGVSGSGKSVLAGYIGLQQARRGRRVLYGAWEMGAEDTLEMMANISLQTQPVAGLTGSRYTSATGGIDESALDSLEERMRKIAQYVRFFDPPFSDEPDREYTNTEALAELHRMIVDSGCEVIVYDLFERCLPDGAPGPERRALFKLQHIHKVTNTHAIIVSQQKLKEVESRGDKRPTRNTILGSQAWVDISDTIIGVHRPALWKPIPDDVIELLLLKQRFGKWPLAIQFAWDGDLMRIEKGQDVDFEHPGSRTEGLF